MEFEASCQIKVWGYSWGILLISLLLYGFLTSISFISQSLQDHLDDLWALIVSCNSEGHSAAQ